jgi:ketosteroid isomerase-like protein
VNADERARRRHLVALPRVAEDCRRTIPTVTQPVDHTAAAIAQSIRRHPSNGRPYDQEAEK